MHATAIQTEFRGVSCTRCGKPFRVVAGPRLCTSPRVLASLGVSSLGEPASRRRSPFYGGSGDGPDELPSFYFVVGRQTRN